jgi:hypothetical protein
MDNLTAHMNCMQLCLYNVCKKHELADYLMFSGVWRFSHNADFPLSQSLCFPLDDTKNELLKKYQGLVTEVFFFDIPDIPFMFHLIDSSICNGSDVIININSYECPWHKGYKKVNIPHYVSVIHIDTTKEILLCDDPYFNLPQQELSFANFISSCNKIHTFSLNNDKFPIKVPFITNQIYEKTDINQITKDIISFSQRLVLAKTKQELFDYTEDVFLCSNPRIFKFIADSRYCLSYLFEHLSEGSETEVELNNISKQFMFSSVELDKVNNYYMKLFFNCSEIQMKLDKIQKKLLEIINIENTIYENLKEVVE